MNIFELMLIQIVIITAIISQTSIQTQIMPINSVRLISNSTYSIYQIPTHYRAIKLQLDIYTNTQLFILDQQPNSSQIQCSQLGKKLCQHYYQPKKISQVINQCLSKIFIVVKSKQQQVNGTIKNMIANQKGCKSNNDKTLATKCATSKYCGNVEKCNQQCYKLTCVYNNPKSSLQQKALQHCLPYYQNKEQVCNNDHRYNSSLNNKATMQWCKGKQPSHLIPKSIEEAQHLSWLQILLMLLLVGACIFLCLGIWYKNRFRNGQQPFQINRTFRRQSNQQDGIQMRNRRS